MKYYSALKNKEILIWNNMDESSGYCVKWIKLGTVGEILNDSI